MFEYLRYFHWGKSLYMDMLRNGCLSCHEVWSGMQIPRLTIRHIPPWIFQSTRGDLLPSQAPRYHLPGDIVWGFGLADPHTVSFAVRRLP